MRFRGLVERLLNKRMESLFKTTYPANASLVGFSRKIAG